MSWESGGLPGGKPTWLWTSDLGEIQAERPRGPDFARLAVSRWEVPIWGSTCMNSLGPCSNLTWHVTPTLQVRNRVAETGLVIQMSLFLTLESPWSHILSISQLHQPTDARRPLTARPRTAKVDSAVTRMLNVHPVLSLGWGRGRWNHCYSQEWCLHRSLSLLPFLFPSSPLLLSLFLPPSDTHIETDSPVPNFMSQSLRQAGGGTHIGHPGSEPSRP